MMPFIALPSLYGLGQLRQCASQYGLCVFRKKILVLRFQPWGPSVSCTRVSHGFIQTARTVAGQGRCARGYG